MAICERSGYPASVVEKVVAPADGDTTPCRQLPELNAKVSALGLIQRAAVDFCGADAFICTSAIEESRDIMLAKYGRMALHEINTAFRMASTGELGEINIVAYNGVFTAGIFGKVMSAYADARDKIIAAAHTQTAKEREEAAEAQREEMRAETRRKVIADFNALKQQNNLHPDYKKVHHWWADILLAEELIQSSPDLWLAAKQIARREFIEGSGDGLYGNLIDQNRRICNRLKTEPDYFPEELVLSATVTYKRLVIFSYFAPYAQPTQQLLL